MKLFLLFPFTDAATIQTTTKKVYNKASKIIIGIIIFLTSSLAFVLDTLDFFKKKRLN